jgi:hypothetical protein
MITFEGKNYYTPTEIAKMKGVDRNSVAQRCIRGTMNGAFKLGRDWLIPVEGAKDLVFRKPSKFLKEKDGAQKALKVIDATKKYSPHEIARAFDVTLVTLYRYINNGTSDELKAIKTDDGYHWEILGKDAIEFFKKKIKNEAAV